ncbi:MAG: hypothetical protein K9G67_09690 [Bacteroidales bacterium]|nr:hypothetical protein [Bacteroidales bacterium]MCF8344941.1 hypothetical protein [Bacteroidales bacterium]MCF8351149.1 hypothetical protein [Bacteroidales bacterium]MCF8376614.1 hypothetical protein [Bacteroidales bacterium]MCF8400664.1 hypothetical protein [Bacteroidales bacterium]
MRFLFKISLFALFIGILMNGAKAQEIDPELLADSILYKKTISGGAIFHTRGLGLKFQKGKNLTVNKNLYYEAQFVSMKSNREIKSLNPYFVNAKPYIYGKQNYVFMLRAGVGINKRLNQKPYWGGVELRYTLSGGVSMGLAKPVYLYIINFTSSQYEYEITTEKYEPENHYFDNIYGRAPFTEGIGEMKFYPGIYGKAGLDFEIGTYKTKINSFEAGGILEIFPKGIPIMAYNEPRNFFFTLYISYSFGKRYNTY